MDFKKATRDTNFDDFINGAEEKEIAKPSEEKDKEQIKIILKLPKDLCEEIDKRVIRRARDLGLKAFTKRFLLEDNPFLTDEAMLKIYQETTFYNLNIAEYIKQKLGFIEIANKEEVRNSRLKTKLVIYSKEEKELLKQKAEALNLPINRYNIIKLKIGIVTTNLFNEEEMQIIIKESSKANLSPKEYISNKILK
ncbi:hypothetical protein [Campylobacter lanienae]|uniref:hypothetical protein n=1 Tax=Campylobacter lanienae TaxID=75658 RepID=UPI00242B6422|nr:hypothetical protein [Campylobacter lanienae]